MSSPKPKSDNQQLLNKKWRIVLFFLVVLLIPTLILVIQHCVQKLEGQNVHYQKTQRSEHSKIEANYQLVSPDIFIDFDKDFYKHPTFHHESWRYKANVMGDDGKQYGVQWSLFRIANGDRQDNRGWQNPQVYTSKIIVSNDSRVWSEQRASRGGIGQAGVVVKPLTMWIDNWVWRSNDDAALPSHLSVHAKGFSIDLTSSRFGPFVANGENGYKKITQPVLSAVETQSKSLALYSFSAPFIKVDGKLNLGNKEVSVQGLAWLDKEWGNHLIANDELNWNNFNIHLNDGRTLGLTQYRYNQQYFISGTLSDKSGNVKTLESNEVFINSLETFQMLNGQLLPLRWVIEIPNYNINLITQFYNQQMWFPFWTPSWEGPISVTGSQTGVGFMQLTGY